MNENKYNDMMDENNYYDNTQIQCKALLKYYENKYNDNNQIQSMEDVMNSKILDSETVEVAVLKNDDVQLSNGKLIFHIL